MQCCILQRQRCLRSNFAGDDYRQRLGLKRRGVSPTPPYGGLLVNRFSSRWFELRANASQLCAHINRIVEVPTTTERMRFATKVAQCRLELTAEPKTDPELENCFSKTDQINKKSPQIVGLRPLMGSHIF